MLSGHIAWQLYAPLYAFGELYGVNLGVNRDVLCMSEPHNIGYMCQGQPESAQK